MEQLDRYPWTGHRTIIGKADQTWMDRDAVLSAFGGSRKKAVLEYRRFVRSGLNEGRNPELTGGGLIRSQGGWSHVIGMRRRGQREEYDDRILGSGSFVNEIFKEAEERQLRQMRHKRSGKTIQKILEEECKDRRINPLELTTGGKRPSVSAARAAIASRCREELGASAAEIARYLGVSTSGIIRSIERSEKVEKGKRK